MAKTKLEQSALLNPPQLPRKIQLAINPVKAILSRVIASSLPDLLLFDVRFQG